MATCEFTLVPCPKQCKDKFMRKDLNKHLKNNCPNRDHKCEYCERKGTYAHITLVHDGICKQKILPCPNKCTKTMPRQDIEKHVELECEYTVIACKLKNIGCTTEMKRRDMAAHEQNESLHLSKALNAVVKLQDYISELQDSNTDLQESMTELQDSMTELQDSNTELRKKVSNLESIVNSMIAFKLSKFQKKKDSDEVFISPSFYTSPGGYHMVICVYANGYGTAKGTHVSISAQILKGKYDTELSWPFVGKVTFTLLNQLEDKNHKTTVLTIGTAGNIRVGNSWGFSQYTPHSALAHDPVENTQYLKDDTLYLRVPVEVSDHKPWLECTLCNT